MRFAPLVPKPKPSSNTGRRKPQRLPFARSYEVDQSRLHDPWESAANDPGDFTTASSGLPARIMPKLEVGSVNDPLERQADAIADRVMRMPAPAPSREPSGRVGPESGSDAELETEGEDEALSDAPTALAFAGGAALPGSPGFVAHRKCASCEGEDEIHRSVAAESVMRECETCEDEDEIRRACASCEVEGTETLARKQAVPFEVVMEFPVSARHRNAPLGNGWKWQHQRELSEHGGDLRRACSSCATEDDELHRREAAGGARGGPTSQDFTTRVHDLQRSGGQPLSPRARAFLESRMGVSLTAVRVHTDPDAGLLAQKINARAFTLAQHVFFAPGELRPDSQAGMRLLAHEVAHTLQNSGRVNEVAHTPQSRGLISHDLVSTAHQASNTERVNRSLLQYEFPAILGKQYCAKSKYQHSQLEHDDIQAAADLEREKWESREGLDDEGVEDGESEPGENRDKELRSTMEANAEFFAGFTCLKPPEIGPIDPFGNINNSGNEANDTIDELVANIDGNMAKCQSPDVDYGSFTSQTTIPQSQMPDMGDDFEFLSPGTFDDLGSDIDVDVDPDETGVANVLDLHGHSEGWSLQSSTPPLDSSAALTASNPDTAAILEEIASEHDKLESARESLGGTIEEGVLDAQSSILTSIAEAEQPHKEARDMWRLWGAERQHEISEWLSTVLLSISTLEEATQDSIEQGVESTIPTVASIHNETITALEPKVEAIRTNVENEKFALALDVDSAATHAMDSGKEGGKAYSMAERTAIASWQTLKQNEVLTYGDAYLEQIDAQIAETICEMSRSVAYLGGKTTEHIVALSAQLARTTAANRGAAAQHAADLFSAVSTVTEIKVEEIDASQEALIHLGRELLRSIPEQAMEQGRLVLVHIAHSKIALSKFSRYVASAGADTTSVGSNIAVVNQLQPVWTDLRSLIWSIDIDGEKLAESTRSAGDEFDSDVASSVNHLGAYEDAMKLIDERLVDPVLDLLGALVLCTAEAAVLTERQTISALDQLSEYVNLVTTSIFDELPPTEGDDSIDNMLRRQAVEDLEFGQLTASGHYSNIVGVAHGEAWKGKYPALATAAKIGKMIAGAVAILVATALILVGAGMLGIPVLVLVIAGLAATTAVAIRVFVDARNNQLSTGDAMLEVVLELAMVNAIGEELSKSDPNYYKVGAEAAGTLMNAVGASAAARRGGRTLRRYLIQFNQAYPSQEEYLRAFSRALAVRSQSNRLETGLLQSNWPAGSRGYGLQKVPYLPREPGEGIHEHELRMIDHINGEIVAKYFDPAFRAIGETFEGAWWDRMRGVTEFAEEELTVYFGLSGSLNKQTVGEELQHVLDYLNGARRADVGREARAALERDIRTNGTDGRLEPDGTLSNKGGEWANKWWHRRVFTRLMRNAHAKRYGLGFLEPNLKEIHAFYREMLDGDLTLEQILTGTWEGLY